MPDVIVQPIGEARRLARLRSLAIMDTPPEEIFDRLVGIVTAVCQAPMGSINLVDEDRVWSKAGIALPHPQSVARHQALCAQAIGSSDLVEIPDLLHDPCFAARRVPGEALPVRFYAGMPLVTSDGASVGVLCVMDRIPRALEPWQRDTLKRLARSTVDALEMRGEAIETRAVAARLEHELERLYATTPAMMSASDPAGRIVAVSDRWLAELGYARAEVLGQPWAGFLDPASRQRFERMGAPMLDRAGTCRDFACKMAARDGTTLDILLSATLERNADGRPLGTTIVLDNLAGRRGLEEALRASRTFLERSGTVAGIGGWELDLLSSEVTWSEHTCRLHDREPGFRPTLAQGLDHYSPEARPLIEAALDRAIRCGEPWDLELRLSSATGRSFWARVVGSVECVDGIPIRLAGAFQDVTTRRLLEERYAEQRQLLQVTLDSIGDGVITTDNAGMVTWMNPAAERLTGWDTASARGTSLAEVFVSLDELTRLPAVNPALTCLSEQRVVGLAEQVILRSRDDCEYGIADSAAPIRDAAGRVHGAVLVFHDLSEQRRLSREMTHRATHDALTGVSNRAAFERQIERLIEEGQAGHVASALLYIDLDQFKVINDTCGHAVGDELLRQASQLLKGSVRERDMVARIGGDEFCVLLRDCEIARAQAIAQRICTQAAEHRFLHEGRRFRIGMSIGIVEIGGGWSDLVSILQAADSACHAAKAAGRNQVHVWSTNDEWAETRRQETQWVSRLEQALDEDRFELYGQRIQNIHGGDDRIHCEVLLRLRESDGSLVLPGAFIQAAERFHMASRLDRHVVRKTLDWLGAVADLDRIDMIAINLSGQSIGDRSFRQDVGALIRAAGARTAKLCFEITETAAILSLADAQAFIGDVRSLGARVALDDFGAGASSFSYLRNLPVDYLKIDGQFIKNLLNDTLDRAAVKCFRDVAAAVGVRTIAEFVEHPDQFEALAELGIDMAQGYLLHRPEPIADAIARSPARDSRLQAAGPSTAGPRVLLEAGGPGPA